MGLEVLAAILGVASIGASLVDLVRSRSRAARDDAALSKDAQVVAFDVVVGSALAGSDSKQASDHLQAFVASLEKALKEIHDKTAPRPSVTYAGDGAIVVLREPNHGAAVLLAQDVVKNFKGARSTLRTGIAVGRVEVVPGPGEAEFVLGEPVVLASRLAGIAMTGQALLAAEHAAELLSVAKLSTSSQTVELKPGEQVQVQAVAL